MRPPESSPSGAPGAGGPRRPSPTEPGGDRAPVRSRIFAATVELVVERGYDSVTVADIARHAGVEEAEFRRHFSHKEDCCIQAFDDIADRFDAHVRAAVEGLDLSWRDRLRAAAYATARYFRDHESEARFGMLELYRAGEMAQTHREDILQRQVWLIDSGRQELEDPDSLSRSTAEVVIGSVLELVVKELSGDGLDRLEALVPQLMFIAVRPYLGLEAAREELTIPPPPE